MIRSLVAILFFSCSALAGIAQDTIHKPAKKVYPYSRKEEIIYDGKRYRLYNNYVTMGGGFALSTIRDTRQKTAGLDFNFHIRRQYFQAGLMMSGEEFFSNSHLQGHFCYGLRKEGNMYNLAFFAGPSIYQGVAGRPPAPPEVYEGLGLYASLQLIRKLTYDIGAGLELFCDLGFAATGKEQVMYGAKVILFFSGSYRGVKRNYNPNVRSENPNG